MYASDTTYNVYVWFNYFYDNGGGAVAVYTRGGWIYSNQFVNNHKEFPHLNPGGQLMLGEGSRSYYVYYNWINGQYAGRSCAYFPCPDPYAPYYPGYEYTSGMEIYGAAHYFYGNHVTSHRGDGIDLIGVNSPYFGGQPGDVVQVRSDPVNLPNYRIENNWDDGIGIQNQAGGYLTSNVTINGIKSEYNTYAGVAFYNTAEVGPILDISIDNCCLLNNGGGPIRYLGGGYVQVTIGCTTCNCP